MNYEFFHGQDILQLCGQYDISVSEVMLRYEMERSGRSKDDIWSEMQQNLTVMRTSIQEGLDPSCPNHGVISGGDAVKMMAYAPNSRMGKNLAEVVAAAMAVVEVNASMGRIVAAPTAGASGILPAVLIVVGKQENIPSDEICKVLFTALEPRVDVRRKPAVPLLWRLELWSNYVAGRLSRYSPLLRLP